MHVVEGGVVKVDDVVGDVLGEVAVEVPDEVVGEVVAEEVGELLGGVADEEVCEVVTEIVCVAVDEVVGEVVDGFWRVLVSGGGESRLSLCRVCLRNRTESEGTRAHSLGGLPFSAFTPS